MHSLRAAIEAIIIKNDERISLNAYSGFIRSIKAI